MPSFLIQGHFWLSQASKSLSSFGTGLGNALMHRLSMHMFLLPPRLDWALLRADDAISVVVSQDPVQYWSHIGPGGIFSDSTDWHQ